MYFLPYNEIKAQTNLVKLMQMIEIEGKKYRVSDFSETARKAISMINLAREGIAERVNQKAVFNRAMNSYISDLKMEIIEAKSGIDVSSDSILD